METGKVMNSEEPKEYTIKEQELKALLEYLENIPHGIAKRIHSFLASALKPAQKNEDSE